MAVNTYDQTKDLLYNNVRTQLARYGRLIGTGLEIEPSDIDDFEKYLEVMVAATGDVKFLPVINDAAKPITLPGLSVGYIIPFQVRRIFATGTTATLVTLEKVF